MNHIRALAKSLTKQAINNIKAKLPSHIERDADRFLKERFYSRTGLSYMEDTAVGLVLAENMPVDRWSSSPQGRWQQANSILEKQQEINPPFTSRTYTNNDYLMQRVNELSIKQDETNSKVSKIQKELMNINYQKKPTGKHNIKNFYPMCDALKRFYRSNPDFKLLTLNRKKRWQELTLFDSSLFLEWSMVKENGEVKKVLELDGLAQKIIDNEEVKNIMKSFE